MAKVGKWSFWNEGKVKALLTINEQAVYDAVVAVYRNQTPTEQATDTTVVDNGKGFGGMDAEFGSSLAKQILAGRQLTSVGRDGRPGQIHYARRLALKYWKQFALSLQEEREAQGLPTEIERPPKGAQPEVDRFTWKVGDLKPVTPELDPLFPDEEQDQPVEEAKTVELFDGDELRSLVTLEEEARKSGDYSYLDNSPEFAAAVRVNRAEKQAWLRLVEAAHGKGPIELGTVPVLAFEYKQAEDERQRTMRKLGLDDQATPSGSYAARWHRDYGSDYQAYERWVASEEYKVTQQYEPEVLQHATKS